MYLCQAGMHGSAHVEVGGPPAGVGSLLPPFAPGTELRLPDSTAEPSPQPLLFIYYLFVLARLSVSGYLTSKSLSFKV